MTDLDDFLEVVGTDVPGRTLDPRHHCTECGVYVEDPPAWWSLPADEGSANLDMPMCQACYDGLTFSFRVPDPDSDDGHLSRSPLDE